LIGWGVTLVSAILSGFLAYQSLRDDYLALKRNVEQLKAELAASKAIDVADLKRSFEASNVELAAHKCALGFQMRWNKDTLEVSKNIKHALIAFRGQVAAPVKADGQVTQLIRNIDDLSSDIQAALDRSYSAGMDTEAALRREMAKCG
jgi:hypothetical protein